MELDYVIDTGLEWPKGRSKRRFTDHIQIHHTVGVYGTPAKWKGLHEKKIRDRHKGVGYSYLICKNGDIYLGRGLEFSHGGVKDNVTNDANQRSVAIAFDGDMRSDSLPTAAQLASCVRLVDDIRKIYDLPVSAVLGHNEIPTYKKDTNVPTGKTYATLCPSMDMDELRAMLRGDSIGDKPQLDIPADDEQEDEMPIYPALYEYSGATYVNLRSMASSGSDKIGKVSKDEKVIVLGTQGEWAEVIKHEETPMLRGWCIAKYLQEV